MFRLKHPSFFNWFRCVAGLLVIGLVLPTNAALAKTPPRESGRFSSYAPANGSQNQSGTTSRTASTYWSQLAVPIEKPAGWKANVLSAASAGPNLIHDPGFESFVPPSSNPYWGQTDNIYGTPLCNDDSCGFWSDAHPYNGVAWAWFGAAQAPVHTASLSQNVFIPNSCVATLQFYFWIGYAEAGSDAGDAFFAKIDGVTVFSANATQMGSYPAYTPVSINVSSFANDALHTLQFSHMNTDQDVGFHLDDVSLTTVSGVCISGNAGAASVALNYTDGAPRVALADGNGNYSIVVPSGWSGTVTPSLAGVTFNPPSRPYASVTTNQVNQNYTALVTLSGNAGAAGATLNYTGGSTTANGSGNYSFTVPYGWSGTVTPSLNADAFCPASQSYNNLTTSRTLQHFAHAACPNFNTLNKWTNAFDLSHGWTVSDFVRTVGDVSGDGKADAVGFGLDGVYVGLSNGSSFATPTKWTSSFDLSHGWTVAQFVRTVGDVNGDGKADLVGFGVDGVYVSLSTGSSFPAPSKWTSAFDLSHGWTVAQFVRTVGDVNGDGRADLVGFGLDGVYVATSTGSGFNAVSRWTGGFALANGWTVAQYVRTVGDVNGDGKADVVGFGLDGVYIGLSTGSTFSLGSRRTINFDLSHGWTVAQYIRTVGDVNGGGKADLVGFGQDGVYISQAQ